MNKFVLISSIILLLGYGCEQPRKNVLEEQQKQIQYLSQQLNYLEEGLEELNEKNVEIEEKLSNIEEIETNKDFKPKKEVVVKNYNKNNLEISIEKCKYESLIYVEKIGKNYSETEMRSMFDKFCFNESTPVGNKNKCVIAVLEAMNNKTEKDKEIIYNEHYLNCLKS